MELWNQTSLSDFILLGLVDLSPSSVILFGLVFLVALAALIGNILFLLLIQADRRLHSPMYFFLSNLSIMDLTMMTAVVPKMIANLLSGQRNISWGGCSMQVFLVNIVAAAEGFLLAVMAYDRYVAICHPLRYPMIITGKTCFLLALACWLIGTFDSVINVSVVFTFPYCASREVDHFFCEVPAVLRLSCKDTSLFQNLLYVCCILMLLVPLGIIVASYVKVLSAVMAMPSTEGKQKALTTCSSHLTAVGLYYGGAIFTYMQRPSTRTPVGDRVTSILYTTLTPMLNPLIYTLRNKDVTRAMRKMVGRWGK